MSEHSRTTIKLALHVQHKLNRTCILNDTRKKKSVQGKTLRYHEVCLMYNPRSSLLDSQGHCPGAVQLAAVDGERGVGLSNLLQTPELAKRDCLEDVNRKGFFLFIFFAAKIDSILVTKHSHIQSCIQTREL